jgi:osmotically inducible protein OsmC
MKRTASAQWQGSFKNGKGILSTQSRALSEVPYSFHNRFENEPGTNPEELIAAAHAGCFSMALSNELGQIGLTPDWIETEASVSFDQGVQGWHVSSIHLDVSARVPGASVEKFERAAQTAKIGCPISKLLKVDVTMEIHLDQAESNRDAEMNL